MKAGLGCYKAEEKYLWESGEIKTEQPWITFLMVVPDTAVIIRWCLFSCSNQNEELFGRESV